MKNVNLTQTDYYDLKMVHLFIEKSTLLIQAHNEGDLIFLLVWCVRNCISMNK